MTIYSCHDCRETITPGEALLRSISFQQVAYCRQCWQQNHSDVVPAPRRSPDEARRPIEA